MLAELLAHDGVREEVALEGRIGFMALHGGIETGTAELARASAACSGASLYLVEVPPDLWWHVPSTSFDPAHSLGLSQFLDHVEAVVSLHGFGRPGMERTMLLGGSNRPMAARLAGVIRPGLDCTVVDQLDAIPSKLRGIHPANPVNLPPRRGVQVEMTADLREEGMRSELVTRLAGSAVSEMGALGYEGHP